MKKLCLFISLGLLGVATSVLAQPVQSSVMDQRAAMATEGCNVKVGIFPTPKKLACLLSALGISEKDAKARCLAIIFSTCQGHMTKPIAGATAKTYGTLGECLRDPTAIGLIKSQFTEFNKTASADAQCPTDLRVVNPSVLTPSVAPTTAPSH